MFGVEIAPLLQLKVEYGGGDILVRVVKVAIVIPVDEGFPEDLAAHLICSSCYYRFHLEIGFPA